MRVMYTESHTDSHTESYIYTYTQKQDNEYFSQTHLCVDTKKTVVPRRQTSHRLYKN